MSTELVNYLKDGACAQARATLAFLQSEVFNTFPGHLSNYIHVGRWENGREQGYIINFAAYGSPQLNIAFFEHRNSDDLCALLWEQFAINTITIETATLGNIYKSKYDIVYSVDYGEAYTMALWICEELDKFMIKNNINLEA